jgi:DNA repair protein RadD
MTTLRDYQQACVDALWSYFEEKDGNPVIVAPTGSGKSLIIAGFVRSVREAYPDTSILVLTHVRELVQQDASKLEALLPWGTVGVYSAGLNRRELGKAVTVASVQSLARALRSLPRADLVIIDEAHLLPPKGEGQYRTVLASLRALNPHLKVIGMSATPYRLKSGWLHEGEGRIFTDIAHEVEIGPLVAAGWLCALRSKSGASEADLTKVSIRGGEYVPRELEAAFDRDDLIERTLDEVEAHAAERRKWLLFCAGVRHAEHVLESLRRRGHAAELVTGETASAERDELIAKFRAGEFRALVNVSVLTTGFDAPDIDAVVLMRATKSAGLYCQMVGRAMRPHESKTDALVLDFGGNIMRHGPVDAIMVRARKGKGAPPQKLCPEPTCRVVNRANARTCSACGFEFPIEEKPPHETAASSAPVLSTVPSTLDVSDVSYATHRKAGKPDSLRVTYHCGLTSYSEWVCLEHEGFAQQKAAKWWRQRGGDAPVPTAIDEALERAEELWKPRAIRIRRDGEFWRVLSATREGKAA